MNMIDKIEEEFNQDVIKLLQELKLEEIANKSSEYKIEFRLRDDKSLPTIENQRRIIKMLSGKKLLSSSPYYHTEYSFNEILKIQGALPIGYYLVIKQPEFDNFFNEVTNKNSVQITSDFVKTYDQKIYSITKSGRKIIINKKYVITTLDFNGKNEIVFDYLFANPDKLVRKEDIRGVEMINKSFPKIITELKFKGEIRKLFFQASKGKIQFRNNIGESELFKIGVNKQKLEKEISELQILE